MSTPTTENVLKVVRNLPSLTADPQVWDSDTITERWAGIAGTIRAYWYMRVTETAAYLDLSDSGGSLPITQIHRQAKEMLEYWDRFIALYGVDGNPDTISRATKLGKIKRRYPRNGSLPLAALPYRSPYGRT